MTAHVSKEELGLMLPGTMNHYFQDEPEFIREPVLGAGMLTRLGAWISAFASRHLTGDDLAGLTDAQLADIGLTRADAARAYDATFAADYNRGRVATQVDVGRVYAY
jgi:uncharacterized protein YjiS (DUF1127 family)